MQFTTVILSLAAAAAVNAQAVSDLITPTGAAPPSCTGSYDGKFQVSVVKPPGAAKREAEKRQEDDACAGEGALVISLQDGIMKDSKDRTGYIASNFQFQFDGPPQAGAIYTGGFSVCGNDSVALGDTTVFYQCLSGGFYNLYNKDWAAQCNPVHIQVVPCGGSTGGAPAPSGVVGPNPATAPAAPAPTDAGTAPSAAPAPEVSQIGDGQPQAPSAAPSIATGAGAHVAVAGQVVLAAAGLAGAALF